MRNNMNRRAFLRTVAAGSAASVVMPAWSRGEPKGPNDRITLGFIGVGTWDAAILAASSAWGCADHRRLRRGKRAAGVGSENGRGPLRQGSRKEKYKGCAAFNDFRELLVARTSTPCDRHPGPLARDCVRGRRPRRQGHLLREAANADHRRGPAPGRGSDEKERHFPDRQPAAQRVRQPLPRGGRVGPQRPHRQDQDGSHRRRRSEQAVRPAGTRDARRHGLGHLARSGAETRLQRNPMSQGRSQPFPGMAQITASTRAAAWPTWGRITSTSPSGRWTWTAAAR